MINDLSNPLLNDFNIFTPVDFLLMGKENYQQLVSKYSAEQQELLTNSGILIDASVFDKLYERGFFVVTNKSGVRQIEIRLSLNEISVGLENFQNLDFRIGTNNKDLLDKILPVYYENAAYYYANPCKDNIQSLSVFNSLKRFEKIIKKMFNEDNYLDFIRKFATDADIALLKNDVVNLEQLCSEYNNTNLYFLSTKLRCFELAKNIYTTPENEYTAGNILINLEGNDNATPLQSLNYSKSILINNYNQIKTLGIIFNDNGRNVWDSKDLEACFEHIKPSLDKFILYGNGNLNMNKNNIIKVIEESVVNEKLELALIIINAHGENEKSEFFNEVIKNLPHNIAKNTFYIYTSCLSGAAHKFWEVKSNDNTYLFTDANDTQISQFNDFSWENLNKVLTKKPYNILDYFEFFSKFNCSNPQVSGEYNSATYHAADIKTLYPTILSQIDEGKESQLIGQNTCNNPDELFASSITTEQPNISPHEITYLNDILGAAEIN